MVNFKSKHTTDCTYNKSDIFVESEAVSKCNERPFEAGIFKKEAGGNILTCTLFTVCMLFMYDLRA